MRHQILMKNDKKPKNKSSFMCLWCYTSKSNLYKDK
jgi:hypothetical protein